MPEKHFQNHKAFYQMPSIPTATEPKSSKACQAGSPQLCPSSATAGFSPLADYRTPLPTSLPAQKWGGGGGSRASRKGTRRYPTQSDVGWSLSEVNKAEANESRKKCPNPSPSKTSPTPVLTAREGGGGEGTTEKTPNVCQHLMLSTVSFFF